MDNPLGVSPSKGNQGTTRGKEKSFDLDGDRHELRGRTEKVGDVLPLLGLTPSGLFMGSISSLIYTSELILCSSICNSSTVWVSLIAKKKL